MLRLILILFCACALIVPITSCSAESGSNSTIPKSSYESIYWSDGDSGRLGEIKFRLANIDAPETGSLKQRGGAKCEAEREIGYEAKAFLVSFTKDKTLKVVRDYGKDRYGRLIVDLTADGVDVAQAGVLVGHLRDWPHKNGRSLKPKPDWCEGFEK